MQLARLSGSNGTTTTARRLLGTRRSPAEYSPHGGGGESRGVPLRPWGYRRDANRVYHARGLERLVHQSARTCCACVPPCSWIGRMEDRDAGQSEQPSWAFGFPSQNVPPYHCLVDGETRRWS